MVSSARCKLLNHLIIVASGKKQIKNCSTNNCLSLDVFGGASAVLALRRADCWYGSWQ